MIQHSVRDLKPALDRLYADFNQPEAAADPVNIVRAYRDPADREIVGFCAAALAFGRVTSVLSSIGSLLRVMGDSPARFVRSFDPSRDGEKLKPVGHRWIRSVDVSALLWILRHMIESACSVENFFAADLNPEAPDIEVALESFSRRVCAIDLRPAYGRGPFVPGVRYFFPRPSAGSACKRLNLFLRWMVRRDSVDLAVWSRAAPSQLIIPLDTHVIRLGQCLRLTDYRSPGWRMAADITNSLRALDPDDPVKYDFALCHLGMMNACGFNRAQRDTQCPLRGICRPAPRTPAGSRAPSGRR